MQHTQNLKRRDHLRNLVVDRRIIFGWILGKQDGKFWTGLIRLRIGTSGMLL
jgi:hypothetical protein